MDRPDIDLEDAFVIGLEAKQRFLLLKVQNHDESDPVFHRLKS